MILYKYAYAGLWVWTV